MSNEHMDQNFLLKHLELMRKDIESVMDVLEGKSITSDCWDTSDYNNWVAMQNFLCDVYDYIDSVHTVNGIPTYEDDSPPEDEEEIECEYKVGTDD